MLDFSTGAFDSERKDQISPNRLLLSGQFAFLYLAFFLLFCGRSTITRLKMIIFSISSEFATKYIPAFLNIMYGNNIVWLDVIRVSEIGVNPS